jgi:hypothetical protein
MVYPLIRGGRLKCENSSFLAKADIKDYLNTATSCESIDS